MSKGLIVGVVDGEDVYSVVSRTMNISMVFVQGISCYIKEGMNL